MYNIQTLNKISKKGLAVLDANYTCADEIENPDGIILRSFKMHDMELPASLRAVARAGAGVNNIPIDKCTEQGVVVFNTPGANANAVKELVIAGLFLASRGIVQGIPLGKSPAPSACGLQWLRLSAVFHLGREHVCFQRSREHAEAVLSFPLRCVSMVIFLPSVRFPHSVLAQ